MSQPGVVAFGDWSEPLYDYNYLPAISFSQSDMANGRYYTTTTADTITISWPVAEGRDAGVQVVLWGNGRFQLIVPAMSGDTLLRIGF